ncbi:MAG: hypothetical protein M3Z85_20515 [Acidobacteriota bacterium]|nr:hypothetical protein [Acidobacteriota bacterium]
MSLSLLVKFWDWGCERFEAGLTYAEQSGDIPAPVHDMQNQHNVIVDNAMDDDIIVSDEATQAGTQIVVTSMLPLSRAMWIQIPSSSASASGESRSSLISSDSGRRLAA